MPPFAYVPGQTKRHPDNWFDDVKGDVPPDMPPAALQKTTAFRAGLAYLDAGYFWEAHEVLEAVWMHCPRPSPEREMVQALIQLANAQLKLRMARPNAAIRLCGMVEAHLDALKGNQAVLGILPESVREKVRRLRAQLP